MKSSILPTSLFFLAVVPLSQAVQISADPFLTGVENYSAGINNLVTQGPAITGYSGNWLPAYGGAQSPDVLEASLDYPGLTSTGGAISYTNGGNGRCGRVLSTSYGNSYSGSIYVGVLVQLETASSDYRAFELHEGGFDDGGNRRLQIAVGESVGGLVPTSDFALRINETTGMSLGAHDTDVNLFVIRIDFSDAAASDTVTVYRNPTDLTVEANNTASATVTNVDFRFDRTSFARFNSSTGIAFDELRIGTTFNDITGVVNPDADNDGMDDGWEFLNNVDDPDADADTDTLSNLAEFLAGTDPNQADTDGDTINDAAELDGSGNAFDGAKTLANNADSDGDSINDGDEVSNANGSITNPNNADTDEDGENDDIEIENGTDPRDDEKNSAALGNFITDGTRDSLYGDPLAVQSIQTGFGDNQNELNAAYAAINKGKLYLLLTGNIETNFNKLEIFLDSAAGGSNVFTSAGNDNAGAMDNFTFDTEMTPEFHLILRRGGDKFDLDFADLTAGQYASYIDVFLQESEGRSSTGAPTESTFDTNPSPIGIAYDNRNSSGIGGNTGEPADQVAAAAVNTGIELCIDLADLGSPVSDLRICAFINNSSHDFISNQFLGALPESSENPGAPGLIDLSTVTGDQFFTVPNSSKPLEIIAISYEKGTGDLAIEFTSSPAFLYRIESSPDLNAPWTEIEDGFSPSDGETSIFTATEGAPHPERRFYRVTQIPKG